MWKGCERQLQGRGEGESAGRLSRSPRSRRRPIVDRLPRRKLRDGREEAARPARSFPGPPAMAGRAQARTIGDGGGRFPNSLIDAKKAIAWARRHAPEYDADPTVLGGAGSSAGANPASMAALTPTTPRFSLSLRTRTPRKRRRLPLRRSRNCGLNGPWPLAAAYATRCAPFFVADGTNETATSVEAGQTPPTSAKYLRQPGRLRAAARRGACLTCFAPCGRGGSSTVSRPFRLAPSQPSKPKPPG